MSENRSPNDLLTEAEKRELFDRDIRGKFSKLGIKPELLGTTIRFGPKSQKSWTEQFELAMALGAQLASEKLRDDFMPQVHTVQDFEDFAKEFSEPPKRTLSAIARDVLKKINSMLPRMGGPGRNHILSVEERELAMSLMRQTISDGDALSWKEAAKLVAEQSEELLKKKIAPRTLEKLASDEHKKRKSKSTQ